MRKVDDPPAFRRGEPHPRPWLASLRKTAGSFLWRHGPRRDGAAPGETRLRAILDAALDGIVVADSAGHILEFNPEAQRIFGCSREEALGQDVGEILIPPRARAEHRRTFAALARGDGDQEVRIALTAVRPDGVESPVEMVWAAPDAPRNRFFLAYVRDISERRRSEEPIGYQDALTRIVTGHTADALFLLDTEGRITFVNPAGEKLLGWTAGELTGANLHERFECSCGRARACPHTAPLLQPGSLQDPEPYYDAVMVRKDGERIEVVCSSTPVVRDGAVAGGVTAVRNMTQQRRAERELLEVSERLKAHFDNSPLAAVEFAPDGRILRWNLAAESLFGWPAAEIVGLNLAALPWLTADLTPVDGPVPVEQSPERLAAGRSRSRSRTRDGRIVDLEWHRSEFRNARGELISRLWRGLDVTARHRAEEAVRESEERFRAALEQASAGIAHLDERGRFLIVNDKYCEIVGYRREELLGRTFLEITHPDDAAVDSRNNRALLEGEISNCSREKRYIRKDGATVWVNITVSRVCDTAGKFRSILTIVDDISDRKKAEERLQQSHDRYRFLADAMPQMVFTATPDGQVDYHNRGWLAYTGQSLGAGLGRGWAAAVHPDDTDLCLAGWDAAVASGDPYEIEVRLRRADGENRWHLIRAAPMRDPGGSILQWVGTATDIEDQKRTSVELEREVLEQTVEAREQARRAELASLAKSEFLAMMSHEIRTPMNVIVGIADLIDESALPESQREYVCRMRRASATLLTVINDILDLAAVESRRLQVQRIPFDLSAVVHNVISIMEIRAGGGSLKLACEIAPGLPPRLVGDPDRLNQVLLNLIGNAVKFTEKGSIRLRVTGAVEDGSAALTFSVIDNGIGISPEKQALIFEPFTQADSSITRLYGGTGLGLTISRQLVELMHGRIWLESEPGRGSTFSFTVTLPVEEPQASHAAAESGGTGSAAVPGPGLPPNPAPPLRTLLLVDDSQDNVFLIKEFLKGSPYAVEVAENGMDALARVQSRHYDLVLMDVQMPVIDGHTATRVIRAWESEHHKPAVPIVALTAHALQSEVEKSMQAGCTAHLSKPIQRQTLLSALARYSGSPHPTRIAVTAPEGLEDLSRDYLVRRKEGMTSLRELLEGGDYDKVRRAAHDVKGTGASYGFAPLTDVAGLLEQAAAARDLARMQLALNSMDTYLQSVEIAPRSGQVSPAASEPKSAVRLQR